MKNKTLFTVLFVVSINCYAQDMNIYLETLERFTDLLDTTYRSEVEKIYFEEVNGITDCFPDVVGKYKIQVANTKEKREIIESEGNIYMYRFNPLKFKDGLFFIEISGFSCKIDGTTIVNAGYRYEYNYDCQKQKLNFIKVKGGGI